MESDLKEDIKALIQAFEDIAADKKSLANKEQNEFLKGYYTGKQEAYTVAADGLKNALSLKWRV